MFLLEVDTHCNLALAAIKRLTEAAEERRSDAPLEVVAHRASPMEILSHCSVFLSAASALAKILVYSSRAKTKKATKMAESRRVVLRQLLDLEVDQLANLKNLDVRNSFEHIDERLDEHLADPAIRECSWDPFHVQESEPEPGTFVLKRFDPRNLTISFAKDVIELQPCVEEVKLIESRINPALKRLYGDRVPLWPE